MDEMRWQALQRWGLTGAECRLALLLGEGLSPARAAERLGVSVNTVKTQAAEIYAKLGVAHWRDVAAALGPASKYGE